MAHLLFPALILGVAATLVSAHTAFFLAPWGNRQFEMKVHELGRLKAGATIREGVFSEGFFDLVIYANRVDPRAGLLEKVFIYDERDPKSPLTIIAREGKLIRDIDPKVGERAQLRLLDGSIHKTNEDAYTKIEFGSYKINLSDNFEISEKQKSPPSMTLPELVTERAKPNLEPKKYATLNVEFHRRITLSVACLLFAVIGVGLGTVTNRRLARASGMVLCLIVVVVYWLMYVAAEGLARNQTLPAPIALWAVNLIFAVFAMWSVRRASQS